MANGMADALAAVETDDLRRAVTTMGPHRDDIELTLDAMPSRTQASQGEQRSLALALRLLPPPNAMMSRPLLPPKTVCFLLPD